MSYEVIQQEQFTVAEMAALIDHSLLVPYASRSDLDRFIADVFKYGFRVACLNNCNTEYAVERFAGTGVKVATVTSFPFGALTPEDKAGEIENSIARGAGLVDVVMNIGAAKSGDWDLLYRDMATCAEAEHKHGIEIKVILECCYLTREEIVKSCQSAKKAGMDYVKASTGFGSGAAVLGDVKLMKDTVGTDMGVKSAGPIGDFVTAVAFLHAGAQRLGIRRGVEILQGCTDWDQYAGD